MLKNKCIYISNVSSNTINLNNASSSTPNTLFELMKDNILLVTDNNEQKVNQNNKK